MMLLQKPRNPDAFLQATTEDEIRQLVNDGYMIMYLDLATRIYYFAKGEEPNAEENSDGGKQLAD